MYYFFKILKLFRDRAVTKKNFSFLKLFEALFNKFQNIEGGKNKILRIHIMIQIQKTI